uniref:Uncharacterized protein n=1 Tax=Anopheles atroparvus TaxID=41427 RepID=A0A182IQG9_ANOAO
LFSRIAANSSREVLVFFSPHRPADSIAKVRSISRISRSDQTGSGKRQARSQDSRHLFCDNMSSNGSYNLTVDGELRYLVQWFEEWSDFQREDFVPYLVSYLTHRTDYSGAVYMNGIISAMAQIAPAGQDKPMSLFQCRVKLFNEWCTKWPEEFKTKLLERLEQIDDTFGSRIRSEMDGAKPVNGFAVEVTSAQLAEGTDEYEPSEAVVHHEHTVVSNAVLVADED